MDKWVTLTAYHSKVNYTRENLKRTILNKNNRRQRHWFARFIRKSIAVSNPMEMEDLTTTLFARFHVNGIWNDIETLVGLQHPKLLDMFIREMIQRQI